MNPQAILPYLQIITSLATILMLAYGLYKFLNKPHDTLADEVKKVKEHQVEQDLEIKEIKKDIDDSFDKHRDQKKMNTVFINCMLAFIDFEMAYCTHTGYEYSDDLEKAKSNLQDYLAGK